MEISDIQQAKVETRAAMHEWTTAVFKVRKLIATMEFSRYGSYAYAASIIEALVSVEDYTVRAVPSRFCRRLSGLDGNRSIFLYKCSDYYAPSDEYGILWNDRALAIDWGAVSPVLPQRDANNRKLTEVQQQFLPRHR